MKRTFRFFAFLAVVVTALETGLAQVPAATDAGPVGVAAQYDTTHVYVAPEDVNAFVQSFLGVFGGKSTPQVSVTVTPTPSKTSSQLLQTPVGTVSLFGFTTPIPAPFGAERNGYLVTDMTAAIVKAREAGADVIVLPFPDPIGVDAVVQWPGGVDMQLYWHTKKPAYEAFIHIPENRVYISEDRASAFIAAFLKFSQGHVTSDGQISGDEIGESASKVRRVRIESIFGKMVVYVNDGHLPYPYGRENTGYEVDDLPETLTKAKSLGVTIVLQSQRYDDRLSAIVRFPGGYLAEIHQITAH